MASIFWFIAIAQAFICAGFCSFIAGEKNRSSGAWLTNGFFFGIFALIAIAGLPSLSPPLLEKHKFFGDRDGAGRMSDEEFNASRRPK